MPDVWLNLGHVYLAQVRMKKASLNALGYISQHFLLALWLRVSL